MTVEARPLGVNCNIKCSYCYQNPQREAKNLARRYDLELMKSAIKKEGGPFSLFGGEPLLVPKADLEELWSWGLQMYGSNGIQTNGTLIDADHVNLFKKYKVNVGISIDGPAALNDARWSGTAETTRKTTLKTEESIRLLCREGVIPSLIITLTKYNASPSKLQLLLSWMQYLEGIGIRHVRLHLLESENEHVRSNYALSAADNIEALKAFYYLQQQLKFLRFDLYHDMRKMLEGNDHNTTCVWNACDPYTTSAVRGVEGHGQRSNCGRTNKEGIDFVKSDTPGYERYLALYHTPQKNGGCLGCRFFMMCKGQCPGTALNGDWRNRTEHCEIWKSLYELIESDMLSKNKQPISLSAQRRHLEQIFLSNWGKGRNIKIADAVKIVGQKKI